MHFWRRAEIKKRRVIYLEIREIMNVQCKIMLEERRLKWFGNDRFLKVILKLNVEGTKRKEKHREQLMIGWSNKKHDQQRPHIRRCKRQRGIQFFLR